MSDKLKAILLILAIGTICPVLLSVAGHRLLGTIFIGFIPFAFTCWGLSHLLTGSRGREICANLSDEEREQLNDMARAYGRRIGFRLLPLIAIGMAVLFAPMFFDPNRPSDDLIQNQRQALRVMLGVVVVGTLINLPAGIRQHKRTKEFLLQTEYARRKDSSP